MSPRPEQFHDAFFEESFEAVDAMEAALLRLTRDAGDIEIINTIFRVAHSIKGGASMFGFGALAAFTHTMEALLNELRTRRLPVTAPVCDGLLQSVDVIRAMLAAHREHHEIDPAHAGKLQGWFTQLITGSQGAPLPAQPVAAEPVPARAPPRLDSIRVAIEKLDELQGKVSEIAACQERLAALVWDAAGAGGEDLRFRHAQLDVCLHELEQIVTRLRMLPVGSVFNRFPRLVRDLCSQLGKNIRLQLSGGQIELDKSVLERISDPLVHLVRNSIDHGIEPPAERLAAGKPAEGLVHLSAFYKGGSIRIAISDDGRGLDSSRLVARARSQGLIDRDEVLTDKQAQELIFEPGFTTAEQATELSGRGVGMDVVSRNIKELGGSVELRSEMGKGTTLTIILPLTLAVVDGHVVQVGTDTCMVPILTSSRV
jgi:two-component system chemotaxis sensor kinase CheA